MSTVKITVTDMSRKDIEIKEAIAQEIRTHLQEYRFTVNGQDVQVKSIGGLIITSVDRSANRNLPDFNYRFTGSATKVMVWDATGNVFQTFTSERNPVGCTFTGWAKKIRCAPNGAGDAIDIDICIHEEIAIS